MVALLFLMAPLIQGFNMDDRQYNSLFPDMPREDTFVNETGQISPLWALGLESLFQALQVNFKNEGILFPSLAQADIDTISAIYAPYIGFPLPFEVPDISGQTVFDSTNKVSKQFVITYDVASPPNVVTAQWRTLQYI